MAALDGASLPDAQDLCVRLAAMMQPLAGTDFALVGIRTGGLWVAQALHQALACPQPLGEIDVYFYRDDYHRRSLAGGRAPSAIPFAVEGTHIILVDDVLHTGRTVRAALNELFDYGRPARVDLAVLVERPGRELPITPTWCATCLPAPQGQVLELERAASGALSFVWQPQGT